MCTTSSTAHSIYTALDNRLIELVQGDNPWSLCTSIAIKGPPVENFSAKDAVALWGNKKQRRLLH